VSGGDKTISASKLSGFLFPTPAFCYNYGCCTKRPNTPPAPEPREALTRQTSSSREKRWEEEMNLPEGTHQPGSEVEWSRSLLSQRVEFASLKGEIYCS